MLEFSKKSALVSRGFIGIKHDAVCVMNASRQSDWAGPGLGLLVFHYHFSASADWKCHRSM